MTLFHCVWSFCALVLLTNVATAQLPVPFDRLPAHETDMTGVTTGGAFVDLDRDSWPDLVVANGNDIKRQHVAVYYSRSGQLPVQPDWTSSDIDYHGHLDVGDVNGDGWPDVAVSVFLGPGGFQERGRVKLYLNDGQGRLGALPAWESKDRFFSFACAFGDVDADGDLDLAVATGESYQNPKDYDRLYRNDGGKLTDLPVWQSSVMTHSMDVAWCDVDGDGDLDLGFAGARGGNTLHWNTGGQLQTTPSWTSVDGGSSHSGNSCVFGDIDGDGRPDLVVSDNKQLGGSGTFRAYRNLGGGAFGTSAFWSSSYFANGYCSGVLLHDHDRDGDLDLFAGGWWTVTAIYENRSGVLDKAPAWQTSRTSVVEALFVADVDQNGLRDVQGEAPGFTAGQRLYRLAHADVQELTAVRVDGRPLAVGQYAFHRESRYVSLRVAPQQSVAFDYRYSEAADLGVTNWDQTVGNWVFPRQAPVTVTITPPAQTNFGPGQGIVWAETFAITTYAPQLFVYRQRLEFPSSPAFDLMLVPIWLPGALTIPQVPWALGVPKPLPAGLLGEYRYRAQILDLGARVVAEGDFRFRLVP